MGVFDNFGSLDGIIQVIYQSTSCFVLISNVETASWTVEIGLVGGSGCWWRGSWYEKDVSGFAGSKVSGDALESFAIKLANFIIAGELAISGDWNASKGAEIKLQVNPTGKAPVVIDLVALSDEEGSTRAISILKGIALRAQSRGCRIDGSDTSTPSSTPLKPLPKTRDLPAPQELQMAQERIKNLESEVNQAKQAAVDRTNPSSSTPRPPPGASQANPTRRKRKIVEAEFESD